MWTPTTHVHVHTHTHTHTNVHTHTHTHTHTRAHMHMHTHTCVHTHTHATHTPWLTYEKCPEAAEAYKRNQKHRRTEAAAPLSLCGSPQGGVWGLGLRCRRTGRCTCKLATALLVTAEPLTKVHHSYLWKPFPSYFHVEKSLIKDNPSFMTTFIFPSYFHIENLLTKDNPSFMATFQIPFPIIFPCKRTLHQGQPLFQDHFCLTFWMVPDNSVKSQSIFRPVYFMYSFHENKIIWSEKFLSIQWNSLPYKIHHSDLALAFRSALKTLLFHLL